MKELSDRELANLVRDLRLQIIALDAQIEPHAASRQRTVKLVRGTFLTVGGSQQLDEAEAELLERQSKSR